MERVTAVTFRTANYIFDLIAFTVAYAVGVLAWSLAYYKSTSFLFLSDVKTTTLLLPFLLFYGTSFFYLASVQMYHSSRLRPLSACVLYYLRALSFSLCVTALTGALFPVVVVSRSLLVATTVTAFGLLLVKELSVRRWLNAWRKSGHSIRAAVLIGRDPELIEAIHDECEQDYLLGVKLLGTISPVARTSDSPSIHSLPVLGDVSNFKALLEQYTPDIVIFFAHELKNQELTECLWSCEERGLEVWLKLAVLDRIIYRATINSIRGVSFISFRGGPSNPTSLFIKYALDRVVSAILLLLAAPLLLITALLVKFTSPGPIIFRQVRAGLNGRRFEVLKFRSMVIDAEEKKAQLQEQNEMSGPVFKVAKDPRITPFGRFIRKTSIDELPQLWNVLRGDMSLVGPRPMDIKEVENIEGWHRRRLSMKPGITCIWQTAGRNSIKDFDDWAKLDLEYIDNWSLWLDLVLLLKTIPVVLFGRGAS